MLLESYSFIAVLSYAEDGILIEYPDLPGCFSSVKTIEEALAISKEVLGPYLYVMEMDKDDIPIPSSITELTLEENQVPLLVTVYMDAVREKMNSKFVKTSVCIPDWLYTTAEREGINLSRVLQNALIEQLHIVHHNDSKE